MHDATQLYDAIRKNVSRELRMFGKTASVRRQIFEAATAQSLQLLNLESSPQEIRKVTRRLVRKLMRELNKQKDVVIDEADESDERGFVTLGNGVFPGSSLNARDADSFNTENEIIDHIDATRKLAAFIESIGIPEWRWFFGYVRSQRQPTAQERMRFHRLKIKLQNALQTPPQNVDDK